LVVVVFAGGSHDAAKADGDFVTGCLGCAVNNSGEDIAICLGICVIERN
jgi:hypothetical protein